ncbi:MAG: DegT/DnrJ/EryC1/StrS family aminotransferase [bacterium]
MPGKAMVKKPEPFAQPIYVTRPLLPDLEELTEKLKEVWESKWLTNNGPQHQQLEKKLQELLKVPFLSLFNNGTIALITACQSLRLSGDVITTPFTFPATPHVLSWNNIKPVFCDLDPVTMNIDADKIESMITPQTTGILAVHVFGTPCDVRKIQEIADRYGLKVIYDAAHAFGVEIGGTGISNFGDISMMSFHATKLFHTAEGGALTFQDKNLKARIDLLKNFGIKNEEEVVMPGINGKMNELQAILGLINLRYIDKERAKRKLLTDTYRECLQDVEGVSFLKDSPGVKNSYQYFVIRIREKAFGRSRDTVYDEFKRYNVFTRKYFYPLCSDYTCYRHLPSSSPMNLPVAREVVQEVLSLPLYGELTLSDVEKICDILKSFRGNSR